MRSFEKSDSLSSEFRKLRRGTAALRYHLKVPACSLRNAALILTYLATFFFSLYYYSIESSQISLREKTSRILVLLSRKLERDKTNYTIEGA